MILLKILGICLGGAVGALLRSRISTSFDNTKSGFPLGTFLTNMLASFLLGIIFIINENFELPSYLSTSLEIGFCATLSTFSSLAWQIANMLEHKKLTLAIFYATSTMLCGMLLFELSYKILA